MTRLPLFVGASLAALALASLTGTADARGAHFSGGGGGHFSGGGFHGAVHVGGGVRVGGSYHGGFVSRGGFVRRGGYGYGYGRGYGYGYGRGYGYGYGRGYGWGWGGHAWVGGYNPYWYNPYWYYPGYVPSYYEGSYYPVQGQAAYVAPGAGAPVVVQAPLPRFGIGIFGGKTWTDYNANAASGSNPNTSEDDYGLLARFRLTQGLIVEGEIGKTTTSVDGQSDVRVDRRLGGSLIYEIGARNRFAPYVLAGLGVEQASTDGSYNTTMDYGEIGAGLRFAVTPHFHVTFDLRAGERSTVSDDSSGSVARTAVSPPAQNGDNEDYTRGRLAAILYF